MINPIFLLSSSYQAKQQQRQLQLQRSTRSPFLELAAPIPRPPHGGRGASLPSLSSPHHHASSRAFAATRSSSSSHRSHHLWWPHHHSSTTTNMKNRRSTSNSSSKSNKTQEPPQKQKHRRRKSKSGKKTSRNKSCGPRWAADFQRAYGPWDTRRYKPSLPPPRHLYPIAEVDENPFLWDDALYTVLSPTEASDRWFEGDYSEVYHYRSQQVQQYALLHRLEQHQKQRRQQHEKELKRGDSQRNPYSPHHHSSHQTASRINSSTRPVVPTTPPPPFVYWNNETMETYYAQCRAARDHQMHRRMKNRAMTQDAFDHLLLEYMTRFCRQPR